MLDELITRAGGRCVWCGREPWRRDLTVEHLLPRTRGGQGLAENLALACRRCNRLRGTKPAVAFVRARLAAGVDPPLEPLAEALERLSRSESRTHAEYGRRQLALLGRLRARAR